MKKIAILLTTILLTGGGIFTSCENFLSGGKIKQDLEEAVAFANAEECTLIIKSDAAYGSFLSDGEKKCKVGYTIDLQYTVTTKDYYFSGLEAVSSSDNKISRSDYVEITIQNPEEAKNSGVYKINLKLLKGINDILITPKFEKLENADIKIDGSHGDFLPEKDTYNLIIGRTFSLSFDPTEDWEFIRWKIYDEESGVEIPDGTYLTFKNIAQKNTSFVFNGIPESQNPKIVITAIVAERPQVISYAPMTSGQLKDSTIQVLFDRDMDENSIYFTDDEIDALVDSGIPDTDFLPPLGSSEKHYGYISDGKTYFKNIVLTNNKTGKNINDRFASPFFDNPRTLSIPASKEEGHALDNYTQVLVSIEKEFFYSEPINDKTSKQVSLSQSKKWMYQVNSETDRQPLVIASSGGKDELEIELSENIKLASEASHSVSSGGSGFENLNFMKDGKLKLDLHVLEQNNGSGPAAFFSIYIKKVNGEHYSTLEEGERTEHKLDIYYQNTTADEGEFKDTIDLAEENINLDDGLYSLHFEFKDRSNNSSNYPADGNYYFAVDTKGPEMSVPLVKSSNSSTYTFECDDFIDVKSTEIVYTKDGSEMSPVEMTRNSSEEKYTGQIASVEANTIYDIKIRYTDYAGYVSEETVPTFLTGYYIEGSLDFTRTAASHVQKVFFAGDRLSDYGVNSIKIAWSDGSVEDAISSGYTIPNGPNNNGVYNSDWKLFYKTIGDVSKYATSGTYYIAKKDSLTQKPVYSHTYNIFGVWKMYKFGDYPQSVSTISNYTSSTVYNGWYLGSDGYFYEKCTAKIADGLSSRIGINNGTTYYFKVEPVLWRKLTDSYKGYSLLSAYMVLDQCVYYKYTSDRTISGSVIHPNNYKYSTLRAFLNGKYESGDSNNSSYSNNGFLQKAFTSSAQSKIKTVSVDNGGDDKVFVLSHSGEELQNTSYGYRTELNQGQWRKRDITQYGAAKNLNSDGEGGFYWTRTYPTDTSGCVDIVYGSGAIARFDNVTKGDFGILPALCVSPSDLP